MDLCYDELVTARGRGELFIFKTHDIEFINNIKGKPKFFHDISPKSPIPFSF